MRHKTTFVIGLILAAIFLVYMVTYTVGFNEAAVVTTFGRADEESVYYGSTDDTGMLGNLMFKWPWPVEKVRSYDMRVHVLESRLEEQQTLDKQGVVIEAYVSWRITEPLDFFRSLVTVDAAQQQIRSLLRDARSVIGNYTFDELTSSDESQLQLAEVEREIQERISRGLSDDPAARSWGIEFESVGITRLVLPQPVTTRVFERMRATRERLAQRAMSEGTAAAADIVAQAESARDTILSFAERRAQEIRAEGDAAAAQYYPLFAEAPEFAIFLRKLETYEEVLENNSTFFFDTNTMGLFSEFEGLPDPPEPEAPAQTRDPEAGENPEAAGAAETAEPSGVTGVPEGSDRRARAPVED